MPRRANRLAEETSPYLLQHAHNPVDWFPWGEEALRRAKEEDKPILLSIGYSACHWCHVMERESFENDAIAAQMNKSFVCIKVDREERPDLDDIYMNATVALSGSGGWPMTVFLTPSGEPFFAGTYFPPQDTQGRPGFTSLLTRIAEMWKSERKSLLEQAQSLTDHVKRTHNLARPGGVSEDALRAACRALSRSFDEAYGGFGDAPKFPAPTALSLLLRTHRRTGHPDLLHMATRTLDGMMSGGMYDQLGGGFARYSVDQMWIVPHFEKMLYDNAQLADVYVEAFQATGHAPYRRIARETLDYLLREMQSPSGGFFSASDADSEGVEGKYFVFSRAEVEKAVGQPAATHFCAFYGVTDEGNFDGKNVLTSRRALAEVAKEFGIDQGQLLESLELGRERLLKLRSTRVAPDVDDKVLTAWNGLTIRALANAGRAFSEPRYLTAAERAAQFLLADGSEGSGMRRPDGGLFRTARAGKAHLAAYLEDYAFVADGLLCLYEAGAGEQYLHQAVALTERLLADFSGDEEGALYATANDAEELISRPRSGSDSALPNANAVAAGLLARLSAHTGRKPWRARAEAIAASFAGPIKRAPRAFCGMLCVVDFLLEAPLEIVLSGQADDEGYAEMATVLGGRYLPNRVEARLVAPPEKATDLVADRFNPDEPARAYVCQNYACKKPVSTASDLEALLREAEEKRLSSRISELGSSALPGRADRTATATYLEERKVKDSARASVDGALVSRLALGTHRVGLDSPDHRSAVKQALLTGINLIDTSPAFAFGDSERLIGQTIAELVAEEQLTRESLVIVSKVGVALAAQAEELESKRKQGELKHACPLGPPQGEESLTSGAFCLDAKFIRTQVRGSLERLGLEHLDVCLIQSPEHLLVAGRNRDQLKEALLEAFSTLEGEVTAGRIGRYGILSNTLVDGSDEALRLDDEWINDVLIEAVGKDNHFRALELPISLGELQALDRNGGSSLVNRAQERGWSVLACRPLSPMMNGALLRLVDPPDAPDGATADSLKGARYAVASLEAEFETTFAAQLRLAGKIGEEKVLPLSGPLGQALEQTATRQQFELAETTMLTPRLRHLLSQLDRAFGGDQKWAKFRDKYIRALGGYLAAVREASTEKNRALLSELETTVSTRGDLSLGEDWTEGTWFERALRPLLMDPSITSAVVGLRSEQHVEEALKLLQASP